MNAIKNILITVITLLLFFSCKSSLPVSEFSSKYALSELNGTYVSGNPNYSGSLAYTMNGGLFHRNNKIDKVSFLFNGKDSLNVMIWADTILAKKIDYKGKIKDNYFEIYFSRKPWIIPFVFANIDYRRVRLGLTDNNNLLVHYWEDGLGGMLIFYGSRTSDYSKTYERIETWESSVIKSFESNGKWGLKDKNGKILLEPEYDEIANIDGQSIIKIKSGNKWAMANKEGVLLTPFRYSFIEIYEKDFGGYKVTVPEGHKSLCGYVDTEGNEFIPAVYDYIFSTNLKEIKNIIKDDFMGFTSREGIICEPVFDRYGSTKFEHIKMEGADPDMKYCSVMYLGTAYYFGLDGYLYPTSGNFFKDWLLPEERFRPDSEIDPEQNLLRGIHTISH